MESVDNLKIIDITNKEYEEMKSFDYDDEIEKECNLNGEITNGKYE